MAKNLIQLDIKDKTYVVPLTMGVLEFIEQTTSNDPYQFTIRIDNTKNMLDDVGVLFYAALLSNCFVLNEKIDVTEEEVKRSARSLSFSDTMAILKVYQSAYGTASPEGGADTQPGSALNVA